ncbi:MAG: hypothetical protein ABSG86_23320 [Thermoguttaceae bacterium]
MRFTLVTDGPTDSVLCRHIEWLLKKHVGLVPVESQWAEFRWLREPPTDLASKIAKAAELYPCDVLFVHRDAETEEPERRRDEIHAAVGKARLKVSQVCVIPVRMTEAWLLFDEAAVRWAAGNPNGEAELGLPHARAETLPNPKAVLHKALVTACGLAGRRRRTFDISQAVHQVAEYIDDFSPLLALPAFQALEKEVLAVLRNHPELCS